MKRLNQKGVAMLMAMVAMTVIAILVGELVYMSGVYSSVVFKERDNLRATLMARTGLRMAMLQLVAAKKAKAKAKSMGMGENMSAIDKIWQTPMYLPPPDVPGLSGNDQGTLNEFKKSLGLDGSVVSNIIGSNNRMSINGLVWLEAAGKLTGAEGTAAAGYGTGGDVVGGIPGTSPGSGMSTEQKKQRMEKNRKAYAEIFDGILDKKRSSDDKFRDKYPNLTGAILVGNLLAWMDPETKEDGEGRGKTEYYSSAKPSPYSLKDQPIAAESEYNMIKGFDDTISKLVTDNFSIQATNSLNVNKASMLLISGLIPELTPDALERIEKRRTDSSMGGEYKDAADFWAYVNTLGSYEDAKKKFEEKGFKILEPETSYRIVISAESGSAKKTWVAEVGQLPPKVDSTNTQAGTTQPVAPLVTQPGSTSTSTNTSTESSDTDSLNVLYLRAD